MSTDNPWALVGEENNGTLPATAAASLPAANLEAPGGPSPALSKVAAAILIAGSAAMLGTFFTHNGLQPIAYDFPAGDAYYGMRALCLLATACLLLNRRTREFGSGAALGIAVIWLALHFSSLGPVVNFPKQDRWNELLYLASYAAALISAILVTVSVLKNRASVVGDSSRAARLTVALTGTIAAVASFIGSTMNWERSSVSIVSSLPGLNIPPKTSDCCTFAMQSSTEKAQLIASGVAVLALVVIAVVTRSRALGAGLIIGAVFVMLSEVAQTVAQTVAPIQSLRGIQASDAFSNVNLTTVPLPGYWIAVAGLLLLVLSATLRILHGARRQPYAAHPITEQPMIE